MPDNQDTIIIRRGSTVVTVSAPSLTDSERETLEAIAGGSPSCPLSPSERYALNRILSDVLRP